MSRIQGDSRASHLPQHSSPTETFFPYSNSSHQGFSSESMEHERFLRSRLSKDEFLRQQTEGTKDMARLTSSADQYAAENMLPLDPTISSDKIHLTHALSQLQDSVNKVARDRTDFTSSTSALHEHHEQQALQQKEHFLVTGTGKADAGAKVRTDLPKSSPIPILYASSDEGVTLRQRLLDHNMHPPLPVQALEVDISQKNVLGVVQTLVKEQTTLKQLRHLYAMELERVRQEQRLLKEAQETILLMDAVDTRELRKIQKKEKKEKERLDKKAAQRREKITEARLESSQNLTEAIRENHSSQGHTQSGRLSQPQRETGSNQFFQTKTSQNSPLVSIPQLQELTQKHKQTSTSRRVVANETKNEKNMVMREYSDDDDELPDEDARDGDSVLQFITDY